MPKIHQRHRRTDRRTDGRTDGRTEGRTTYDSNTVLALCASRGKNNMNSAFLYSINQSINVLFQATRPIKTGRYTYTDKHKTVEK